MKEGPKWRNHRLEERDGKLKDKYVFLSASVPYRDLETLPNNSNCAIYEKPPSAYLDVEEAVVSLARAVFAEDGGLVFGGHPSISPLVASLAADYYPAELLTAKNAKLPVLIYQSKCFEGHIPDTTYYLRDMNFSKVIWTEPEDGERVESAPAGHRPCQQSIFHMRDRMIRENELIAMVAIGGMEGVEDEAQRFQAIWKSSQVYVLKSTWGAAARLAAKPRPGIVVAEERWSYLMPPQTETGRRGPMVPYALIMQKLVQEIASRGWEKAGQAE